MDRGQAKLRRRPRVPLALWMALGIGAGLATGALWPDLGAALQPVGTAFIDAIRMVVIPLVFCAVTLGASRIADDASRLGRTALVAFGWFYLASAASIAIALVLNAVFHPGLGAGLLASGHVPQNLPLRVDWVKFVLDLIPSNVVAAMAAQKVLPTLVFAMLFGLALGALGQEARPVTAALEAVLGAMFRITRWVVTTAPLAVFAISAWLAATQGVGALVALAKLAGTLYLGYALLFVVLLVVIRVAGERPLWVARQVMGPMLLAFATRSSEVALPPHIERLEQIGVPKRVVAVVLPLGYSFNLDGSALYLGAAVTFLAEAYGLHLSGSALLTILVTTLIASKGVANVPASSLVALATVLTAIGLPAEAIAVVTGIDAVLDMGRAGINVFGNTAAVLVVRHFGGLPERTSATGEAPALELVPQPSSSAA
ncbi:dicarboxylate/amino acid:cation symporter [Methylobacterium sp. P1-11]|uniref:dicarboxylate/amino acid:cation symporter n=1 Tax=Methylobacterium sp. P1-11 TaxID=2024616 RepID=UPI0011EFD3AF|nr:dicarboxylate/amino acid:cation symporter [Methylobacterium sp. P1-11]KAA0123451.1 dicarboxylate/amino acid:cation symporter [Methylobacterium sp. P1-11]